MKRYNYQDHREEIIEEIVGENITISCIVGENGSGKTKIVNDVFDSLKTKHKCLYIKSEFNQTTLLRKFQSYFNKIMIQEDKWEVVKKYHQLLKRTEDEKLHKFFYNFLSLNDKGKIQINFESIKEENIPSGIFLYSILKTTTTLLQAIKPQKGIRKFLVIDEIEKYAHLSLITQISKIIFSLMKYDINIILTTHSHHQLEKLWINYALDSSYSQNRKYKFKLFYLFNKNMYDNNFDVKCYDNDFLNIYIGNISYRDISNIFRCFFAKKIFLVEGIKDHEFINTFMNKYYDNSYYDVIDCNGKFNLKKIFNILSNFRIIKPYVLIDGDGKKMERFYEFGHMFKDNLEIAFQIDDSIKADTSMINKNTIDDLLNNYDKKEQLFNSIDYYITSDKILLLIN